MKFFTTVLVAAASGAAVSYALVAYRPEPRSPQPSDAELIKTFYLTENAVHVSPHSLRRKMDQGDDRFVLVDLRSPQEYAREHVIGAVNIPAYRDPNTPAYEEEERIVAAFGALPRGKEVIVYCYSVPCMTGRKIGKLLAERGVNVQHLGIGWNEWRHGWTVWNHEHEWATTKPEMYVATGTDPGVPQRRELPSPCGEGELSC